MNLTLTGLSTAQGDSRTPLLANFIGLAGNMILDPLLILGVGPFPRLEVVGAAVATVSSQILVFVVMVLRIRHSRLEPNVLRHLNLLSISSKEYYKQVFRIGFPTAIQGSIYCFISMILTRMVSAYGAAAIATQRVGGPIESVSWNTADGFASALNAFIAQNYGARKKDRIRPRALDAAARGEEHPAADRAGVRAEPDPRRLRAGHAQADGRPYTGAD